MVLIVLAVPGVLVVLAISSVALATTVCVTGACITDSTTRVSSYSAIVTCQNTRALKLIDQSGDCLPTRKIPTLPGWPSSVTVNY